MSLPDHELRARIAHDPWTAHNIRLAPGITTMPGNPDEFDTDRRLIAVERSLRLLLGDGLRGARIVDLGCLEGGFSFGFARMGANVLGIDARSENLSKGNLLREHFELTTLEFAQADVKDFSQERFGLFDVALALGILYHLEDPVAWLRHVAAATTKILVIEGHIAPRDDAACAQLDVRIGSHTDRTGLARLGPLEGRDVGDYAVSGRWFNEVEPDDNRPRAGWAAYSNDRSFWLTKSSLLLTLKLLGFDVIYEQQDWIAERYDMVSTNLSRAMFIACRSSAIVTSGSSRADAVTAQVSLGKAFDGAGQQTLRSWKNRALLYLQRRLEARRSRFHGPRVSG